MAKFGEKLHTLRKQNHWTQGELAEKLGLSTSAVGMYERGQREPNLETLVAIADTFGIGIAELVEPEKAPAPSELEKEMLALFRKLPEENRPAVVAMIKAAIQRL